MKSRLTCATFYGLLAAVVKAAPTVDTTYAYTGPAIPVGDWVDPTVNGNGKGFPRLVEPPAVKPSTKNPSNNVNVIQLSYLPNGINVHYQTPFGLGVSPTIMWGTTAGKLDSTATGYTRTSAFDPTHPCPEWMFVDMKLLQITGLDSGTTYYYQIPAANGTTTSQVMNFTTALAAGDDTSFSMAVLNDMGYTNAAGTFKHLTQAVDEGVSFAWHGGDLSYADDWYSGILPCESSWPVCYNGTSTELPPGDYPPDYNDPLPAGEVPNQGSPRGGDMSVLYESNWDLWQQWVGKVTNKIPYMVVPGNHEAACAEFDGPGNLLTAYLNDDESDTTVSKSNLTYYSCPPSQR
ncbi:hypothetical protein LTS17_004129 [Exophiala oligosperma]